ncbi:unnamed protein product [Brassica rapa subsp. narinosa]|uniref:(rape) hypothetical protein n=1 Tax=Brassica napus TaxID=3708 RepID=A0A816WX02_BRANA|nr:unnamed protein product [Brassica napus]
MDDVVAVRVFGSKNEQMKKSSQSGELGNEMKVDREQIGPSRTGGEDLSGDKGSPHTICFCTRIISSLILNAVTYQTR